MAKPHRQHQDLLPGQGQDGEGGESWLLSYLDVLTLLITLFVLLLSLAGNGMGDGDGQGGAVTKPVPFEVAQRSSQAATQVSEALPRRSGLLPELEGRLPDGIAMSRGQEGVTLRIDDTLLFGSGQAQLTAAGRALLSRLNGLLLAFEGSISVEGHTDSVPIATARFPSNWELSGARAIAVLRHLQELGVPAERLRAIGYADTRPLGDNDTAEGRAANRRVALVLHER
ncbi:OmpA/MotB family protein [Halomonas marinisediminis]|uniref:Flagellar motor protein MotB n=1 Tax=Halomonas marinisediminis TaxID=2546095 RepID=A0ABY2D5J0_9GAMM|nr:OmpA family protein [Halomonas marinisediminis]TDB01949.1 flagellar motor protein MotB [Halomonas marinisediminis]